ncbi:saccharopine dehydrogenase NADP-binding domain-containing protein [Aldersonia sp. NBC_00410]|uniref:saccharopine dehydrogenase family protein n=1 Tax=Aldersonia sp. NBC_00410 TaxID=2975954 RepID=UPI00225BA7F8|nr:saccharopine dehydrogenase NADP-binding domain-containing protein [Aldersonia sp. NBC_00410]MCX5042917.1 saccharopine dehydrogenase NADP-binding domain-containing protein [Aldersonia sp. NBC_00410]
MAERIVLYGATGYTGRLTATELVARGHTPVLAGRNTFAVRQLADELGGLPTATADAADPDSVRALVGRGDVLLSTVGPFHRFGAPAVEAAIAAGANYLDSTGEQAFIRRVFEDWDPSARAAGVTLLTAFGFDYVPGNLAAALALEQAGPDATSVIVGYFTRGRAGPLGRFAGSAPPVSRGTITSAAQAMLEPGFSWKGGELRTETVGHDLLRHRLADGRTRTSVSVSSTEHLSLPRVYPRLREVRVGLGAAGVATPAVWALGRVGQEVLRIPGIRSRVRDLVIARLPGSGGGPSEEHNATSGCLVTAHAYAPDGTELSRVVLTGPSVYGFTAKILAWGAEQLACGVAKDVGAVGPVEAFGLDELERGCASVGLHRAD